VRPRLTGRYGRLLLLGLLPPPVCLHALDPHALAPGPREEPDPDGEADPQDADADEQDPDSNQCLQGAPPNGRPFGGPILPDHDDRRSRALKLCCGTPTARCGRPRARRILRTERSGARSADYALFDRSRPTTRGSGFRPRPLLDDRRPTARSCEGVADLVREAERRPEPADLNVTGTVLAPPKGSPNMVPSDQLTKLAARAKEAEDRAIAAQN
jgi:hypothetical protein